MKTKNLITLAVFLGTIGAFIWGCQSGQPVTPYRNVALSVSVPPTSEVRSSLLGVASNELLYRVDGTGHVAYAQGKVGPFSTSASSGSIDFSANVPAMDSLVLSVQLNDASTHQPLAVGAAGLDMLSSPVTDVVVDMGSVTRNCYTLTPPTFGNYYNPDIYIFSTDILSGNSPGSMGDFQFNYSIGSSAPMTLTGGPASIGGPAFPNIAYLGNGDFVDFDYVPPVSAFKTTSDLAKGAPVALNDIFCIETLSPVTILSTPVTVTGHAWMQVTALSQPTSVGGATAPSFRYRVNSTSPYFGYERTTPDLNNTCNTSY